MRVYTAFSYNASKYLGFPYSFLCFSAPSHGNLSASLAVCIPYFVPRLGVFIKLLLYHSSQDVLYQRFSSAGLPGLGFWLSNKYSSNKFPFIFFFCIFLLTSWFWGLFFVVLCFLDIYIFFVVFLCSVSTLFQKFHGIQQHLSLSSAVDLWSLGFTLPQGRCCTPCSGAHSSSSHQGCSVFPVAEETPGHKCKATSNSVSGWRRWQWLPEESG